MANRLLLILSLLSVPIAAYPAAPNRAPKRAPNAAPDTPAPAGMFAKADALIAKGIESVKTLDDCLKLSASLKADLAKKQKELKAEFGERIPPGFMDLLLIKQKRVEKQEQRCVLALPIPGALFQQAHDVLRHIEPPSTPGIDARFKKIETARAEYNLILARQK